MDINAEVSTQLSLIDVLLSNLDKTIAPCASVKNEKKEEENQDAMPDSTTNTEKNNANPFHCGDDVLVPNKDGRYYLGTIIEFSTSNDNDSCEVGTGVARCMVKFGDGTHSWAPVSSLKLLSAPPADDGRIMCVVCKQREGPASSPADNAVFACDMCGRGYHAKCHSPTVDAWISGASWNCKRCVDQRYRVAAAENRASKRSDLFRYKSDQLRRQRQDLTPPCDTASTTSSTASDTGKEHNENHCYCGGKTDWLAQMLQCCRCIRWFHQRCVSSLQYPLYAGDKSYIFCCSDCNGGMEYLRRLELNWLDLAHLVLYNLTAYNAPNYFDLDTVIMPYLMDNWHALQLPEKMLRTSVSERRERILTSLTSSRKRFKCGREMKKRATIWGLRLRRPPPPPFQLSALEQLKKGAPLSDEVVRELTPRVRFLPRVQDPSSALDDRLSQPNSKNSKSSYKAQKQRMIVPIDGHWLHVMMGKRFHENLNSNSNSENDSTSSYESVKPTEPDERPPPAPIAAVRKSDAKVVEKTPEKQNNPESYHSEPRSGHTTPVPSLDTSLVSCSANLNNPSKDCIADADKNAPDTIDVRAHTSRIATMNLEVSKLSTKNIIEHSKIMSLQHMDSFPPNSYSAYFPADIDSSGDELSSRGTLESIIPRPKDFRGKNNPFLIQNTYPSKHTKNGRVSSFSSRLSLPSQFNPLNGPLIRPLKRKLSEKDIIIGPNGEVKRRNFRRPKKFSQTQLNKSCPLPEEASESTAALTDTGMPIPMPPVSQRLANAKINGRRLRQRQEKNYYENTRRSNAAATSNNTAINSVQILQLSPHKTNTSTPQVEAAQLSALKSSVQSYFRVGQTFQVLARRLTQGLPPAFLIQWDT